MPLQLNLLIFVTDPIPGVYTISKSWQEDQRPRYAAAAEPLQDDPIAGVHSASESLTKRDNFDRRRVGLFQTHLLVETIAVTSYHPFDWAGLYW